MIKKDDISKLEGLLKDPYWRQRMKERLLPRVYVSSGKKVVQMTPTPSALCFDMVERLTICTDLIGKSVLAFNIEFIEPLLKKGASVCFFADNDHKHNYVNWVYPDLGVVRDCFLDWKTNMKFDVMVMNPPYQAAQDRKGEGRGRSGTTLWDKFVPLAFDLVKDGGYVCAVHPSGWRESFGDYDAVKELLSRNQTLYLELHDRADGVRVFGKQSAYDWYVAHKTKTSGKTEIKQLDGKIIETSLKNLTCIPNTNIERISSLFAKKGQERCTVLHSHSNYETRKEWMKSEQDDRFKNPCVYTITKNNETSFWWSTHQDNGHFGISKVIFTNGTSGTICDKHGKYGLTQFAYAIIDKPENLDNIQKAIINPEFLKIMDDCSLIGKHRYNRKTISAFRKDFWKEFV